MFLGVVQCVNTFDGHEDRVWAMDVLPSDANGRISFEHLQPQLKSTTEADTAEVPAGEEDGKGEEDVAMEGENGDSQDEQGPEDGGEVKEEGEGLGQEESEIGILHENLADPTEADLTHELVMVTGGADSCLKVWRDVTTEEQEEEIALAEMQIEQQQELLNAMALRNYNKVRKKGCCTRSGS